MSWNKTGTPIEGCYLIENPVFQDLRGEFSETYKLSVFRELGLPEMVQDNHLLTKRGGIRAMHWQAGEHAQAKLINVIQGNIFDVVFDLRQDSASYMQHATFELNESSPLVFVPAGCAHGFQGLSDNSILHYKTDREYNAGSQRAFLWNDPEAGIDWPVSDAIVSEKDAQATLLSEALKNG